MSRELLYYDAMVVTGEGNRTLPGIARFEDYFRIYNMGVSPVDRTHTLRLPIKTHSLFPLPTPLSTSKLYEDICMERARELLARADRLDAPIYSFWSGGIDSTLALISLVANATPAQKDRITVLLSDASISENPRFYKEHIHGKLRMDTSSAFPHLFGEKAIFINGEHNDQVFGSDIVAKVINNYGAAVIHQPYSADFFTKFFDAILGDTESARFFVGLFEKLRAKAPVPIATNYDLFWWINFALKWQTVHMRMLSHLSARRASLVTEEYRRDYYAPFYATDDFQRWSMSNPDKKIKDTWASYKWTAKDVIFKYTGDAEYRDTKIKRASLNHLVTQYARYSFIDRDMRFHKELDASEYYEPENDFA